MRDNVRKYRIRETFKNLFTSNINYLDFKLTMGWDLEEKDLERLAEEWSTDGKVSEKLEDIMTMVDQLHQYQVEITYYENGATSAIDQVYEEEGFTAEQYVKNCEKWSDKEWVELIHSGDVEIIDVTEA